MKTIKKLFIALFFVLLISYVGISFMLSNRVLNPNSSMERTLEEIPIYWPVTYEDLMALLPQPEEVSIEGFEGISLHGQYFDASELDKCLFIFAHGWGRNWPNMLKYYPMVLQCGCDILMYDHRVHGMSEGNYPTGGIKEAKDLLKVTKWAKENKGYELNRVAWFGSSWGAGAALIAGAEDLNPAFIVADSPYQDWYAAIFERAIEDYGQGIQLIAPGVMQVVNFRSGVNYKEASPFESVKSITEPVLLIHSQSDPETNSNQSVNISKNLNEGSIFHHTQWGNEHVMDVLNNTEEMKGLLVEFIKQNNLTAFYPSAVDSISVD